jgi:hypothetical protein
MNDQIKSLEAVVSWLPFHSGDGYGWGGGVILTIGSHAIPIGEGPMANELAKEIARRWNVGPDDLPKF